MKQQKKITKSNVGVAALGDPHLKGRTLENVGAGLVPARGITLISLVITIVVMLILAGVAISITVSPDGLFAKAQNATDKWNAKVIEEQGEIDKILGYLGGEDEPELNEYGFYFGKPYGLKMEDNEAVVIFTQNAYAMFYENGQFGLRLEAEYIKDEVNGNQISFMGMTGTVSEEGEQIEIEGMGAFSLGSEYIQDAVEEEEYLYYKTTIGWNSMAKDPTKVTYGEIKSTVKGMPVVSLEQAFVGCTNLVTAPTIPSGVTNISKIFYGCTSLEGTVTIEGTPTDYSNCFSETEKQITLAGTAQNLEDVARYYSNVVGPAPVTVTVSTNYPEGWDSEKLSGVAVAGENVAPIPKGFRASSVNGENSITDGLVIYQGEEDVTSTNHSTALTSRNQYVWIPVEDINQMVMCKSNTSTSVCNIQKQQDGTLKCEKHNSEDLCGRLYGEDESGAFWTEQAYTCKTKMNFANRTQVWEENGYREPDIVNSDGNGTEYMADAGIESGLVADFEAQLKQYFKEMVTSVEKYGGFYASRYEVGYEKIGDTEYKGISKKGKKVLTADLERNTSEVHQGAGFWYGLYGAVNKQIKEGENVILQSHMIYGSQYDQIIRFIGSEAQEGHMGNAVTEQSLAGSEEKDKLNNIYDLEGNNVEWTSQANDTDGRVYRGGTYESADDGGFYPASYRFASSPGGSAYGTTRSVLYVAL